MARRHIGVARGVVVGERGVAGFDGELAVAVHRVARVDGEIQQRVLDLRRIDQRIPQSAGNHRFHFDAVAERAAQQIVHAAHEAAEVHHLRRQRLASAEGEQLRGELRLRATRPASALRTRCSALSLPAMSFEQQLQIAADDLQQIVEIVRDAAGEFADRFHLLRLAQGLLDFLALLGFLPQLFVGADQFGGALGHFPLERLVELELFFFAAAQRRFRRFALRDFVLRGLVQARVVDGDRRVRGDADDQPLRRVR